MDNERFFEIHNALNKLRDKILGIKGSEYPIGNGDRLSNFKIVGELLSPLEGYGSALVDDEWVGTKVRLDLEPDVVAAVYMLKHVLSLCTFIREQRKDKEGHEPIAGRIADIQNYGDLLLAIITEQGRADASPNLTMMSDECTLDECDFAGYHVHIESEEEQE